MIFSLSSIEAEIGFIVFALYIFALGDFITCSVQRGLLLVDTVLLNTFQFSTIKERKKEK